MQKLRSRCLSLFLGVLNWLAAIACLSAYQIWIAEYQQDLDQYDDRVAEQKTELLWGNINVLVQGIFLSLVNVVFELVFEHLTHYEKWETRTEQSIRLLLRLADLEFFATALQVPIVLALYLEYVGKNTRIFCVITPDVVASNEGAFDDDWYATNGMGIFIQMLVYFGVNNILLTYGLDVIPKWCARKKDKREDYGDEDARLNIPNTKLESQPELEELHTGSKFDATTRYVYLYITLTCCMMFAGTSYILWPTAALIYFLVYLSDKYLLLNFHPKTNTTNEELHMHAWFKYYNVTIILYIVVSVWSFYVFNAEVMPLYGRADSDAVASGAKNTTVWDRQPGLAHGCFMAFAVLVRSSVECCFFMGHVKDQIHELLGNSSEIAHVASNSYLREIPLKQIREYYMRLLDSIKFAKASYATAKDKYNTSKKALSKTEEDEQNQEAKDTNEYIMLLGRRVEDVKDVVDEFGFILGNLLEYEALESLMTEEQKAEQNKQAFYDGLEEKLFGEYKSKEAESRKASKLDDNRVLQRLLQLEENAAMIYDFYRHRENPDAFRCASNNFSYRIEDDEEFAKALQMYERLKQVRQVMKVENLKRLFGPPQNKQNEDTMANKPGDASKDKSGSLNASQFNPRSAGGQSGASVEETIVEEKYTRKSKTDRHVGALN